MISVDRCCNRALDLMTKRRGLLSAYKIRGTAVGANDSGGIFVSNMIWTGIYIYIALSSHSTGLGDKLCEL